jgi:hypothetical protein
MAGLAFGTAWESMEFAIKNDVARRNQPGGLHGVTKLRLWRIGLRHFWR